MQARIKAKAITSAPFTSYKNGVGNVPEADSYNTQNVNPPPQQQNPVQFTYANVPNEGYNNQQVCNFFNISVNRLISINYQKQRSTAAGAAKL